MYRFKLGACDRRTDGRTAASFRKCIAKETTMQVARVLHGDVVNAGFTSSCTVIFGRSFVKTVLAMLSDRCLSCLSVCLSVTLVYCNQMARWVKMALHSGTEVCHGPGHIVLDGDPVSPYGKGLNTPTFAVYQTVAHVYCGQTAWWMPLSTEVALGHGDIVLDAPPRKGEQQSPTFRPMSVVAKRSPISETAELSLIQFRPHRSTT